MTHADSTSPKLKRHPLRHVAVVGASGGIGQALLQHLAHEPSITTLWALSRTAPKSVPAQATHLPIDITQTSTIKTAAEQIKTHGPLDMVIVATGLLHQGPDLQPEKAIKDLEASNMAQAFAVNATGPALVGKHFLPLLSRDQRGVFACLSARVGSISDNQIGGWYAYRASKAALNMILKNFAIELRRTHKQAIVTGLQPGTVDTELSKPFQSHVPDGKLLKPDVSAAALLETLDTLTPEDSGHLYDWQGQRFAP